MKTRIFLFASLMLFVFSAIAQNAVRFHKKEEITEVFPSSNAFRTKIKHSGVCKAKSKNKAQFYFGELEKITDIKARYQVNNKWKKISKKKYTTSSLLTSSFYSGLQLTSISFPTQQESYLFEYSYNSQHKDLLFLSRLDFTDAAYIDTFSYQIILPKTHQLHYHIEDSLKIRNLVEVTKKEQNENWVYSFLGISNKETEYPDDGSAYVRLIVTPKDAAPYDFYNDWYAQLVKPNTLLKIEFQGIIKKHVAELESDEEKIEAVFNLIKERTNYIAIENGIGAVMPRDVNKIWTAQQGDCKDMSNLLCQSLRAIGYEAQLALSATIGHAFDLDFPSLASANHVICVLQQEGKWLYLDATERSGFFGHPSRQIQGRNIFIINKNEGLLHEVPKVKAAENRVEHVLFFEKKGNGLTGKIDFKYHGLSQIDLRSASKRMAENRLELGLKNYLGRQSSNLDYENVELLLDKDSCQIKAAVNSERNFTGIRKKEYLSLAFLPIPDQQNQDLNEKEIHFYKTCDERFIVILKMNKPVRLKAFEPVVEDSLGISFHFNVNQITPNQIQVNYNYKNELLHLHNESLDAFRNINHLIKKTLQKSIIYEDQL